MRASAVEVFVLKMASSLPILPTNFRSVYRLFLRALSASVLHHPVATTNLRRLYKPVFVQAAAINRSLDPPAAQRWMSEWHQRGKQRVSCCCSLRTYRYTP